MTDAVKNHTIGVIGLGYVGLPVAVAFARRGFKVTGFDINAERIEELSHGHDRTKETASEILSKVKIAYSSHPACLEDVNFYIVTVPTPIDESRRPDLSPLKAASQSVGMSLKRGDIVVYESTVFPGATQEECVPILERASGLLCGRDFGVGYSPERINPGDRVHRFEAICKVVSGCDAKTLDTIAEVYGSVVEGGIHRAPTIKVAEAAKVIENTQRDLNIALMNELSFIFGELGIDTFDVLAAAGTKWNFLPFSPGLPGGHCIPVDPYYLTHRAERAGLHPEVILAGRRVNDRMGAMIAKACLRLLMQTGVAAGSTVTLLGLTFKENVPDIRNTKCIDILRELQSFGLNVQVHDPHAHPDEVAHEFGIHLTRFEDLKPASAVILAVAHDEYVSGGWNMVKPLLLKGPGIVLDAKGRLDRKWTPEGIVLWRP